MIISLTNETTKEQAESLLTRLSFMGITSKLGGEKGNYQLSLVKGIDSHVRLEEFTKLPGVEEIKKISKPYRLASLESQKEPTVVDVRGCKIGGGYFAVMAGPCSIESKEQLEACAEALVASGGRILRGGAFKPRSSPYSFQGLAENGLKMMQEIARKYDLVTVSEVMDKEQARLAANYIDIFQIGTRNMQNFELLKEVGKLGKPVFLKRGFSASYQDLLMAAEYILAQGNPNVILCERGIRTFETHARNTLDIAAVPLLKELTHLPIVIDPSHGVGIRSAVKPMSLAATAAGADGLMIEMHPDPDKSVSDKEQTISLETFADIMKGVKSILHCIT